MITTNSQFLLCQLENSKVELEKEAVKCKFLIMQLNYSIGDEIVTRKYLVNDLNICN